MKRRFIRRVGSVRVRGLHSGGRSVDRAVAGQRTAVNLAGVEHGEIGRGMVLAPAGVFEPSTRVDARITLLDSARPLKTRSRLHFHQGTAETIAEAVLLEKDSLAPGAAAFAQLRLDQAVLLLPGDRFILRQFSPVVTIGGGVVIDAQAPRHRRNDASTAPFLETLERGSQGEILAALAARLPRPLALAEITARAGWTEVEIRAVVKALSEQDQVRVLLDQPLKIAAFELVSECAAAIRKSVEEFHGANPLLAGVPKQELRGRVGNPDADLFEVALDDAVRAGATVISGDLVRRAGREIALTPEEARAKDIIEREFETAGLAVPSFSAVLEKLPVERCSRAEDFPDSAARKGADQSRGRPGVSSDGCGKAARTCRGLQEAKGSKPAGPCIQRTYGRHTQVRDSPARVPRPRARNAARR